jgi:hypothetical protein
VLVEGGNVLKDITGGCLSRLERKSEYAAEIVFFRIWMGGHAVVGYELEQGWTILFLMV